MQNAQPATPAPAGDSNQDNKATGSVVLGVISLAGWLYPIVGIIGLAGIYLAFKGLKSLKRGLAIAGMILSIVGILLSVVKYTSGTSTELTGTEDITTDSQAIDDAIQGESTDTIDESAGNTDSTLIEETTTAEAI
jgi:hypothetical protein